MAASSYYIIRGGIPGRERLRIISRVLQPYTTALLQRSGIKPGMRCLEVGCGGGDVAFDMARMVEPGGNVVATDVDETKLTLAREESREHGLHNLDFCFGNIMEGAPGGDFDLVHARFLLTHLPSPEDALAEMFRALRPGGVLALEDVQISGHFWYPESSAVKRFLELYTDTAKQKGGDPNIGPRLYSLAITAGCENVDVNVVQPVALAGEARLIAPITMENIADSVITAGLATREETERLTNDLLTFTNTRGNLMSLPRIFQVCGRRPEKA